MEVGSLPKVDVTIRFVAHPGPFNALVRFAQYGLWPSHTEVLMPDGRLLGSRFWGGVKSRARDYDAGGFERELYVTIKATEDQAEILYDFLRDQIGKPYDALAILAFLNGRDWQAPDSWFCSELVAAGLSECGLFPKTLACGFNRITPRDLLLLVCALASKDHVG